MRNASFLFVLLAPLAACTLGSSTSGDNGVGKFAFNASLFGDAVNHAVMVGSTEPMSVDTTDPNARKVVSNNANVLSVGATKLSCRQPDGSYVQATPETGCPTGTKSVSLTFDARAVAPGSASLLLLGAGGQTLDSLALQTANANGVTFTGCPAGSKGPSSCNLEF